MGLTRTPSPVDLPEELIRLDAAKASRAANAVAGHLAELDGEGNPADSGKGLGDFFTGTGAAKDAAALGGVAAERYLADCYSERSGAKSYAFASVPGRVARPFCEGGTRIGKPDPDAGISPGNAAELTPARLILSDGKTERRLNADLWALPEGAADSFDGRALTRRVGKAVLDPAWEWTAYSTTQFYAPFSAVATSQDLACLCSHFPDVRINSANHIVVYRKGLDFADIDAFKAYIASNPVTILYELPEPVTSCADLDIPLSAQNAIACTDPVLPSFGLREIDGPARRVAWARDLCRPSLLINGDFRDPVNQRGQTEYTGNGYFFDCWRSYTANCAMSLSGDGARVALTADVTADCTPLMQPIENGKQLAGQRLTLTLWVNEVLGGHFCATARFGKGASNAFMGFAKSGLITGAGPFPWSFTMPADAETIRVGVFADIGTKQGDAISLRAVKLELGGQFTGWHPVDPQQELARCQRHFMRLSGNATHIGTGFANNTTAASMVVPLPVTPRLGRVTPSFKDCFLVSSKHLGASAIPVTQAGIANCSANTVAFVATTAGGLTTGEPVTLQIRSGDGFFDMDFNL